MTKSTIFVVSCNTIEPSEDAILGFYPTRELAEARKAAVLADPDNYAYGDIDANETDFSVAITAVPVTANGADVRMALR
jgi:hypothetical protein